MEAMRKPRVSKRLWARSRFRQWYSCMDSPQLKGVRAQEGGLQALAGRLPDKASNFKIRKHPRSVSVTQVIEPRSQPSMEHLNLWQRN